MFKSTTGHVRPGMSLSGLAWLVGRDVLVRYYPWLIHWFLVNYNGKRGDMFVVTLAIFFTTKHTHTNTHIHR